MLTINPCRKAYVDGTVRPLCRGWLHGLCAAAGVLLFAPLCAWAPWTVTLCAVGKLASYGASAAYHMHDAATVTDEHPLHSLDMACIALSIWSTVLPFVSGKGRRVKLAFVILCQLLTFIKVSRLTRFPYNDSTKLLTPSVLRIYITSFVVAISMIGSAMRWSPIWWSGLSLYLLGGLSAPALVLANNQSHSLRFWHTPGIWGGHEDFHAGIVFADFIFFYTGWQFASHTGLFLTRA